MAAGLVFIAVLMSLQDKDTVHEMIAGVLPNKLLND